MRRTRKNERYKSVRLARATGVSALRRNVACSGPDSTTPSKSKRADGEPPSHINRQRGNLLVTRETGDRQRIDHLPFGRSVYTTLRLSSWHKLTACPAIDAIGRALCRRSLFESRLRIFCARPWLKLSATGIDGIRRRP